MTLVLWVLFLLGFLNAGKLNFHIYSMNCGEEEHIAGRRNKAPCSVFVQVCSWDWLPQLHLQCRNIYCLYFPVTCPLLLLSFLCPLLLFQALCSDLYHCSLFLHFDPYPVMLFSALSLNPCFSPCSLPFLSLSLFLSLIPLILFSFSWSGNRY